MKIQFFRTASDLQKWFEEQHAIAEVVGRQRQKEKTRLDRLKKLIEASARGKRL